MNFKKVVLGTTVVGVLAISFAALSVQGQVVEIDGDWIRQALLDATGQEQQLPAGYSVAYSFDTSTSRMEVSVITDIMAPDSGGGLVPVSFDGISVPFSIEENRLTLSDGGGTSVTYNFSLEGENLILTLYEFEGVDPDGDAGPPQRLELKPAS